jgi:NADH:ubiquinone oxidoreductase subunit K
MDIAWYLVLSAFIFCIGVAGVLTRRSPLVVLISLELMLNAGNLALVAFSKMTGTGDGQIFG